MDETLARRAITGNQQAIAELFVQEEAILYRTAYAYLKNEHDALDAMQDLFIQALRKIHTVKEPKYIRTWLVRALINHCLNELKKKKTQPLASQYEELAIIQYPQQEIVEMLNELPPSEQQLIYMKFFQQFKNKEIADFKQIPEGTVKSKIHHILKKLRIIAGEREDWHG